MGSSVVSGQLPEKPPEGGVLASEIIPSAGSLWNGEGFADGIIQALEGKPDGRTQE